MSVISGILSVLILFLELMGNVLWRFCRVFSASPTTSAMGTTISPCPNIASTTANGTRSSLIAMTTKWCWNWMVAEANARWQDRRAGAEKSSSTPRWWCWETPSRLESTRASRVGDNCSLIIIILELSLQLNVLITQTSLKNTLQSKSIYIIGELYYLRTFFSEKTFQAPGIVKVNWIRSSFQHLTWLCIHTLQLSNPSACNSWRQQGQGVKWTSSLRSRHKTIATLCGCRHFQQNFIILNFQGSQTEALRVWDLASSSLSAVLFTIVFTEELSSVLDTWC